MIPGRAPAWTKTTPYTTMPNSTKALLMPGGEAPIVVVTAVAVRTEGDPTPVPVPEMCKMVVNTRRTEASFTTTCLQTRRLPPPRPQAVLLPRHKGGRMASTFQTGVESNGFFCLFYFIGFVFCISVVLPDSVEIDIYEEIVRFIVQAFMLTTFERIFVQ